MKKLSPAETTINFSISLTESQYAFILQQCNNDKRKRIAYIRKLLDEKMITQNKKDHDTPTP